jgi:prepilin-type N-terminal cleavage/methylation domain-containing protein
MKKPLSFQKPGFTLLETVIAIGVLAVLLTGFFAVFGPAAAGIRRALNVQEADRLSSTLERELVTVRAGEKGNPANGFEKAYDWIAGSYSPGEAIFVYQYRGDPSSRRTDGTLTPVQTINGTPGKDYIVQPIARRLSDPLFREDLRGVEGGIFLVKCLQLTYNSSGNELEANSSNQGKISDPAGSGSNAQSYSDAVIAFAAEFHSMPSKSPDYYQASTFNARFNASKKPVFVRNFAVRR